MMLRCKECGKRAASIIVEGQAVCNACALEYMIAQLQAIQTKLNTILEWLDEAIEEGGEVIE